MSLMAGFDLIVELSNGTVLKLIKKNLMIDGHALAPPFELDMPLSGAAVGTAHLVCTDVQLSLESTDHIVLLLPFRFMTVVVTSPLGKQIGPLAGTIRISAPLAGGAGITVDLAHADASLTLDAAGNTELAGDLSGTPVTAAMFLQLAGQALTDRVRATPSVSLPVPFSVVPGVDGKLGADLQVEALEVHCIGNSDPQKQALGLFGTLLVAHHGQGHHAERTATAISAASDGVAISLSPSAFDALIFRPATAGIDPGDGVHLDSLTDSFGTGVINVDGAASKSGFCYDAHATFHGTITLTASGKKVTPHVTMGEPDVDVDIPWYCYVVAGVVLGPLGAALVAIVDAALDGVSISLGEIGSSVQAIDFGSMSGVYFNGVDITPEGLTIQGHMYVSAPSSYATSALELTGSVITTSSVQIAEGTFTGHTLCDSEDKTYDYTESQQQQRGVYSLTSELTVQPLTPVFSLRFESQTYALTGTSGTLTVPDVKTQYMMPMGAGGSQVTQTVHVGYSISGTQVTLTNVPTEGNYSFKLVAEARDIDGDPVKGLSGSTLSTQAHVTMEGDHVSAPAWTADVQACMQHLREMVMRILHEKGKLTPIQEIPEWPPVNYPPPEDLLELVSQLVRLGLPEADRALVDTRSAHGSSYYRAMLSPQARQSRKWTAAAPAAEVQARLDAAVETLGQLRAGLERSGVALRRR